MNEKDWILLDSEKTCFAAPIFVVELVARRMREWKPDGEPPLQVYTALGDVQAVADLFGFVFCPSALHHFRKPWPCFLGKVGDVSGGEDSILIT